MQSHTFAEAGHKLSTTTGVYVITEEGKPSSVALTIESLREQLEAFVYDRAIKARVFLTGVEQHGSDDLTHLIFQEWVDGYETWESWVEEHGHNGKCGNGFVEFWFGEFSAVHQRDYLRRYTAMRAPSFEPASATVITLAQFLPAAQPAAVL